jgi:hypothetical protein
MDMEDENGYIAPPLDFSKTFSSNIEESKLTRSNSFKIFEDCDIQEKQVRLIDRVTSVFKVSDTVARSLLLRFFWDFELVQREYLNNPHLVYQLFNFDPYSTMQFETSGDFLCPCCYMET